MDTHLDSLSERLREPRVRGVIEPMLSGGSLGALPDDDVRYAQDLGLIRPLPGGGLTISNPMYAQVIPRMLAYVSRAAMPAATPTWQGENGDILPERLLAAFLAFWHQRGAAMLATAAYAEVAAQLVMMAWLDRVANGGGRVEREYALGSGRIDLCLHWRKQRLAFELKVWREGRPDPALGGVEQLDGYLGRLGLDRGWLVIFDQRGGVVAPSASTIRSEGGREVTVVRA
jgi:hypothetical protein